MNDLYIEPDRKWRNAMRDVKQLTANEAMKRILCGTETHFYKDGILYEMGKTSKEERILFLPSDDKKELVMIKEDDVLFAFFNSAPGSIVKEIILFLYDVTDDFSWRRYGGFRSSVDPVKIVFY